jgi:hypothetical protein
VYLRARYYNPVIGRFQTRDLWHSDYNQPFSLNPWLYAYNNPVNLTEPSGMVPDCDPFKRADLTQWLVDEINVNRSSMIAEYIKDNLSRDPISQGLAVVTFWDVVKTNAIWDFKQNILRSIGRNVKLVGYWYSFEVLGNIHFGYLGIYVGFDKYILHCGADFATDKKFCSGADSVSDYESIEAGFDIYRLSGGGLVDKNILEAALAAHPGIAQGEPALPVDPEFQIPWPYPAGTFDDGSSGLYIKHRGPFPFPGS